MPFQVICWKHPSRWRRLCVTEWHDTLLLALDAMAEHQQQPWDSVALVPVLPHEAHRRDSPMTSHSSPRCNSRSGKGVTHETSPTDSPSPLLLP